MSSQNVLRASLRWGGLVAAAIAVVGAVVGGFADGPRGAVSGLSGAVLALVFSSVTAVSILVANRKAGSELFAAIFFATVMGGWLVKFIVFLVVAWAATQQAWLNDTIFFLAVIAAVIGTLVVDTTVMLKTRTPYASDAELPEDRRSEE